MVKVIGNPIGWALEGAVGGARLLGASVSYIGSHSDLRPKVHRLTLADLGRALRRGLDDFTAMRTDVIMLVFIYPIAGLLLVATTLNAGFAHIAVPLITGFALLGPVAGIGLYQMSKQREAEGKAGLSDAFGVVNAETIGPVLVLSGYLFVIFGFWIFLAHVIYEATMGAMQPASVAAFLSLTFSTQAGWVMAGIGSVVGFVLALLVLVTSLISFPMLVDRPVGLPVAVITSLRVAARNPVPVAIWGVIIAALLALGALPAFVGLVVVFPVLGHASWHLYRAAVSFD